MPRLLVPAGVVSVYIGIVLAIGAPGGWRDLGVPGAKPSFLDLHSVTSAWDCTRRGVAVLPVNPCDPMHRPANYPRIWLLPSHLGWGEGATVPLGIGIAVLFLATAVALAPRDGSLFRIAAYSAFLCTPGIMLGVERGNVDLLLFCLVALAVWLLPRAGRGAGSASVILLASILKLFPIFATPLLLRLPRRGAIAAFAAVGIMFGAYALATLGTIRAILRAVPKAGSYSYGVDILGHPVSRTAGLGSRYVWDAILVVLAVGCAYVIRRALSRDEVVSAAPQFEVDAFIAGVSTFALTYVFFRNFDYRLSFLLLCLPLLLRRAAERQPVAWAALLAMLGALCFESRPVLPVGVLAQYALFISLIAFLGMQRIGVSAIQHRRLAEPA